jgi:S1-C subfamily serine protease
VRTDGAACSGPIRAATRGGAACRRPIRAAVAAASAAIALAIAVAGCAEDSASPRAAAPRLVCVVGAGSERATGFAVASGRVVTVAHAVEGVPRVRVRAGGRWRRARVLRVDRRADLALLAVTGLRGGAPRTTTAGNEEGVRVLVLRDGRPAARRARVRRAIDARVAAPGQEQALRRPALELEARTRAGDSGAPVVSQDGDVMGVIFARSRNRADIAYAVDARALDELLAEGVGRSNARMRS